MARRYASKAHEPAQLGDEVALGIVPRRLGLEAPLVSELAEQPRLVPRATRTPSQPPSNAPVALTSEGKVILEYPPLTVAKGTKRPDVG